MKKDEDSITSIDENGLAHHETKLPSGHIQISQFRQALPQFLAVGVKNILLFVYGMSLGFPTIVIPAIQGGEGREPSDIVLNRDQISWFSSINLICVPLGCIFSGSFSQPIGKRRAMQLVNIPIIASWLLFHFATRIEFLYAALFLSGLTGGLMEAPVLTYVAEISQPKYRGLLSASGSTFVVLGVFLQFILGSILDWRTIAAVSTIFPVISIITLFFVPESPTWLIKKNRLRDAVKSLQWLRGWVPEHMVENEFNELYDNLINENNLIESTTKDLNNFDKILNYFSLFKKRSFVCPFCLIVFTFFVGHFSGKTTLQTYAVQIFHTLKAPINKYHATVLLGLCELIATILCVVLIHFTGKRPLVFISTIGVSICFCGTATYAYYLNIVPGFAINNVVANASALIPKDSIITTDNITKIFQDEQKNLLNNNYDFINNNNNTLNRTERDLYDVDLNNNNDDDDENLLSLNITNDSLESDILTEHVLLANEFEYTNFTDTNFTDINEDDDDNDNNYDKIIDNNNKNNTSDSFDILTTPTVFGSMELEKVQIIVKKTTIGSDSTDQILLPIPKQKFNSLVWLPLLLLLGSAFFAHLGLRLIPWMLIGEVFPASVRSNATGFAGGSGYILGFLANKFFLQMLSTMTLPGTFWFYSAVALFGAIVMYFILPETENITLGQCEQLFVKKTKLSKTNEISKKCILPDNAILPIGLLEIPINDDYKFIKNGKENKGFQDDIDDKAISRTTHF